jgi:hypothetical protein
MIPDFILEHLVKAASSKSFEAVQHVVKEMINSGYAASQLLFQVTMRERETMGFIYRMIFFI